jgi:hypothetical protein
MQIEQIPDIIRADELIFRTVNYAYPQPVYPLSSFLIADKA